jgi:short-subunit dehydrogenase
MTAFTEGLYLDLQRSRSKTIVQALCPGLVYTEFHDKMGADRRKLGRPALWQTPQAIVSASLRGLERKELYVIPGWRYSLLTTILSMLPVGPRMQVQQMVMRGRGEPLSEGTYQR